VLEHLLLLLLRSFQPLLPGLLAAGAGGLAAAGSGAGGAHGEGHGAAVDAGKCGECSGRHGGLLAALLNANVRCPFVVCSQLQILLLA
jgi:hypothetical protein